MASVSALIDAHCEISLPVLLLTIEVLHDSFQFDALAKTSGNVALIIRAVGV